MRGFSDNTVANVEHCVHIPPIRTFQQREAVCCLFLETIIVWAQCVPTWMCWMFENGGWNALMPLVDIPTFLKRFKLKIK